MYENKNIFYNKTGNQVHCWKQYTGVLGNHKYVLCDQGWYYLTSVQCDNKSRKLTITPKGQQCRDKSDVIVTTCILFVSRQLTMGILPHEKGMCMCVVSRNEWFGMVFVFTITIKLENHARIQ